MFPDDKKRMEEYGRELNEKGQKLALLLEEKYPVSKIDSSFKLVILDELKI
jgi:hypothetical protein